MPSHERHFRQVRRITALTLVGAVLGLGSAGCGSKDAVIVTAPKMMKSSALIAAARESAAATSGRFSSTGAISLDFGALTKGLGGDSKDSAFSAVDITVSSDGSFAGARTESSTTVDVGKLGALIGQGGPKTTRAVSDGTSVFVEVDGEWKSLPLDGALVGKAAGGWAQISESLAKLNIVGKGVTDLGTEEVRGVKTFHRRVTIDRDSSSSMIDKQLSGIGSRFPGMAGKVLGSGDVPFELWVDEAGLVRRMEMTIESPLLKGHFVIELWDPAAEISIDVPTATGTLDPKDLLGGADA